MGTLNGLREDLEGLADELDRAVGAPEAGRPAEPEVARAHESVAEARAALASAFLSRRALIQARQAVGRAHSAVAEALKTSRVLRERSALLRATSGEVRTMAQSARATSGLLAEWSRRSHLDLAQQQGEVAIDSAIPIGHPQGAAIERVIRERLGAVGGRWSVSITVPEGATWWGLRVKGPDIDWVGTLQEAADQTPEGVRHRLEPLLQIAAAEWLYRHGRRGRAGRTTPGDETP